MRHNMFTAERRRQGLRIALFTAASSIAVASCANQAPDEEVPETTTTTITTVTSMGTTPPTSLPLSAPELPDKTPDYCPITGKEKYDRNDIECVSASVEPTIPRSPTDIHPNPHTGPDTSSRNNYDINDKTQFPLA